MVLRFALVVVVVGVGVGVGDGLEHEQAPKLIEIDGLYFD